jgi:hypothetical protein
MNVPLARTTLAASPIWLVLGGAIEVQALVAGS